MLYDPNSKVNGANMGPIWGRQDPGGLHIGIMNFAIWEYIGKQNWGSLEFLLTIQQILDPMTKDWYPGHPPNLIYSLSTREKLDFFTLHRYMWMYVSPASVRIVQLRNDDITVLPPTNDRVYIYICIYMHVSFSYVLSVWSDCICVYIYIYIYHILYTYHFLCIIRVYGYICVCVYNIFVYLSVFFFLSVLCWVYLRILVRLVYEKSNTGTQLDKDPVSFIITVTIYLAVNLLGLNSYSSQSR